MTCGYKFNSICTHTRGQTFKYFLYNPRRRVITDLQPVYVTNLHGISMVIPNTSLISIRRSKKTGLLATCNCLASKGKRAIELQTWVLWFCLLYLKDTSHQRKLFTSVLLGDPDFCSCEDYMHLWEGHSDQEAKTKRTCSLKRTPCQAFSITNLESPRSDDCCMLGPLSLCQPNISSSSTTANRERFAWGSSKGADRFGPRFFVKCKAAC